MRAYAETAAKAKELGDLWEGSAWRDCLSDHELAKVLGVNVTDRILARVDSRMKSGEVTAAEAEAAVTRTSELVALVPGLLEKAQK
ncbi:hypothetical protein [Leisingera sp. JC1]|uniref:hypothetical protein n=1 Tax=Leisingera sp. JC1 TaxID=1855282 RepID=UPI000802A0FA|nr:hypothetical protein [Leisingera sp. JC1]OBY25029.1 hypothetical protein A9D60_07320 [Leisingera sp. JC1]